LGLRRKAHEIADYLENLLLTTTGQHETCVFIPSPVNLAGFFRCTIFEINKACELVRQRGYDYRCMSLDSPITLIRPIMKRAAGMC
jgi:hypothetical protein